MISATGVIPATEWLNSNTEIHKTEDNFIIINELMETSCENIYSAGDCCEYQTHVEKIDSNSNNLINNFWFQMKLWNQAKIMGIFSAKSMISNGDIEKDFSFEMFAHVTRFFGYKVVIMIFY